MIFGAISFLRFKLYDLNILKRYNSDIPTIVIGNIRAGGTGKTPMIIHFAELFLKKDLKIAVLSRGYGRKTKGFFELNDKMTSEQTGDEPLLIKSKFPQMPVFVCENRVEGVRKIAEKYPDLDLILLDDAFQHFRLKADLYFLLTEWGRPFYNDFPLPAGMLREFRKSSNRADFIITTKTPKGTSEKEIEKHLLSISKYSKAEHFFSQVEYQKLINIKDESQTEISEFKGQEIFLLTGISNPEPIKNFLDKNDVKYKHFAFRDHENIPLETLNKITDSAVKENKIIITTEKDVARIGKGYFSEHGNWYILPIGIRINLEGELIEKLLKSLIKTDSQTRKIN